MAERQAQSLLESVRHASSRERARARVTVVALTLALSALATAAAVWLLGDGRWIWLPPLLPVFALTVTVALTLAALFLGWRNATRVRGAMELARAIERERAMRRGSLSGLLELDGALPLRDLAASRLAVSLPAGHLAPKREQRSRRLLLGALAMLIVATVGFSWSGARNRDAIDVLLHPMSAARGELLPRLRVTTGSHGVPRGSSATVDIAAPARRTVRLHTRVAGAPWQTSLHVVDDGAVRVQLKSLGAATVVYASDARGSSDTLLIRTLDHPFVRDLALEATYPPAFGRPPEPLSAAGQLLLPEGTTVRVRGTASIPLQGVELLGGAAPMRLQIAGDAFAGSFPVRADAMLHWRIAGRNGEVVEPPPPLNIVMVADLPAEVEIVAPAADTVVSGDRPVRVIVRAGDDHELSSVVLRVRQGQLERSLPLAIPPAGGSAAVLLDITGLAAGTHATLDAVATEAGERGRRSVSASRSVRLMTAAEQREGARSSADSAARLAAAVATGQRQVERQTIETAQSRGERRQGAGDDPATAGHALASRARALVDEQRSLASRSDSLAAATRALESRLARAGALDDGLAARLAEVRALLERALTPELAARLREAEAAARANEEEPLRRSLTDVAREQRRAREQLERVVQMLRRAAIEGALETLRAEALEIGNTPVADAAGRAELLTRDIGVVLERMTQENARAGLMPARRAREHAAAGAAQLRRGVGSEAGSAELRTSAQALGEARAAQIEEWKRELAADIDAAVQELLQLSSLEEALAQTAARSGADWRAEQSALEEGASAVAGRIARAARTSSLVSSRSDGLVRTAREQVARVSARAFPPRDVTQTSALMREAAGSLSRAAASLVRDRERTNAARSASGFTELLEELQRLAQQQRGLNAAAEGLPLNLLSGNAAARETARTLARQQRAIARSLEELGDADGGARAQPLAAEANRIADALERAMVDASVLQRQERLYHRLLEGGRLLAGDSGEDDERREARTAQPGELSVVNEATAPVMGRRHRVPGWNELRTLTPAERQMIVEYFERLNDERYD